MARTAFNPSFLPASFLRPHFSWPPIFLHTLGSPAPSPVLSNKVIASRPSHPRHYYLLIAAHSAALNRLASSFAPLHYAQLLQLHIATLAIVAHLRRAFILSAHTQRQQADHLYTLRCLTTLEAGPPTTAGLPSIAASINTGDSSVQTHTAIVHLITSLYHLATSTINCKQRFNICIRLV